MYCQWGDSRQATMLCYVFVICLVLPSFTLAEGETQGNKTKTICDKPEVKDAGDKFLDCFNKTVTHSNSVCETQLEDFVQIAKKTCYNKTSSGDWNARKFIKLVQYSNRNGAFKDFVNSSGLKCLHEVREKVSKCVHQQVGAVEESSKTNSYRVYEKLWQMTSFTIDKTSCKRANEIKHCTLHEMRAEGCKCKNERYIILYVESLFNYMLEECTQLQPDWMKKDHFTSPKPHKKDKSTRTTHALLGVLLTLAILAIFYVCVRDCRAPRGQWKTINERISMSMINRRRRSLVNNEACQG